MKIFLGGTCNGSTWREKLISLLNSDVEYFNPVVEDWSEAHQQEEMRQRLICDYVLYVITPKMTGVYSIAEVVDDSHKRAETTLFCFLNEDDDIKFTESQSKSLLQVCELVSKNGVQVFTNLEALANHINTINKLHIEAFFKLRYNDLF